jgi:hypothetical protein
LEEAETAKAGECLWMEAAVEREMKVEDVVEAERRKVTKKEEVLVEMVRFEGITARIRLGWLMVFEGVLVFCFFL